MSRKKSPLLDRHSFLWVAAAAASSLLPLSAYLPGWLVGLSAALMATGVALKLRDQRLPLLLQLLVTLTITGLILWHYGVVFGGRFGRDTGTALLAAMVALKLLELDRLRDARLLTGVTLFVLMAGFLQDRGPLTLTLSLAAMLISIAALARLADVELPQPSEPPASPARRFTHAGRLVMYSLPLAIVAFFLFPRLAAPLWGLPGNSQDARTGLSDSMSPGDISQLFVDDSPMLRVRFFATTPENAALYWRGPVLDRFDGRRWTPSDFSRQRRPAELLALGLPLLYEVQQEPTEREFVFALDMPLNAPTRAQLSADRTLFADRPLNEVSRWQLSSLPAYRFEPSLTPAQTAFLTRLPDGFDPRSRALAESWRTAAGDDSRAVIQQALDLFNREFSYTLTPPLLGRNSVDDFLFASQAGYCEHFASSFTVLMRAAGIPARVVTGYQGGVVNEVGGYLVVRQSDAHAWSETWLEGEGWVRVDPTAAVAPERIERGTGAAGDALGSWADWGQPLFDTADWVRRGWNNFVLGYDAARQKQLLQPLGIDPSDWRELAMLLIGAVAIALAITLALLLRRPPDGNDPVGRAWNAFLRRLSKAGARKAPNEGPLAFAERAAALLPLAASEIAALSRDYAEYRYAAGRPTFEQSRQLSNALRTFRIARSRQR